MIVLIIAAFIIGFLVGAKQEQKRILKPKGYTPEPEVVEQLQTLAGIKEHDRVEGSRVVGEIIESLQKKKDASVSMFKDVDFQNKKEYEGLGLDKAKLVLDKSIEETKRFNEYRKKAKIPKEIKTAMLNADKSEIPEHLLKQNRAEIEANEAASVMLTGETDSHYYYKTSKDKKK